MDMATVMTTIASRAAQCLTIAYVTKNGSADTGVILLAGEASLG
jgi:hypothetical protein